MLEFLKHIPLAVFTKSLSQSIGSPTLLEIFWCHEFYRLGYSLLRQDTFIHGQVQKVDHNEIQGKVDFVVKNGGRIWVIEFLICGDIKVGTNQTETDDHVQRFSDRYKAFNKYDHLVVDFRPGKAALYQQVNLANYWLVYYDPDNNFQLNLRSINHNISIQPS